MIHLSHFSRGNTQGSSLGDKTTTTKTLHNIVPTVSLAWFLISSCLFSSCDFALSLQCQSHWHVPVFCRSLATFSWPTKPSLDPVTHSWCFSLNTSPQPSIEHSVLARRCSQSQPFRTPHFSPTVPTLCFYAYSNLIETVLRGGDPVFLFSSQFQVHAPSHTQQKIRPHRTSAWQRLRGKWQNLSI